MRHYLIRQLLCDAGLRGRMEEIRQLVFKEVGIIIEYRVPLDFRMQLKPRLNFISTNVVFFIEEWSDVETWHYLLLNEIAAVFETAPGGREHDFEAGNAENDVADDLSQARLDAQEAMMALPRSLAIYDPVDVEKEYFHAAPWNETRRSQKSLNGIQARISMSCNGAPTEFCRRNIFIESSRHSAWHLTKAVLCGTITH